jgi:regulator of ribosome biosynthesis
VEEGVIPFSYDLGSLTVFDANAIPSLDAKKRESWIHSNARDVTQVLVNHVFSLPTESTQDGYFALLPDVVTPLPREKPVPKEKTLTRWEKFAKAKGINKTKKSRVEFDEGLGEFVPKYGFRGIKQGRNPDLVPNDWLVEVPDSLTKPVTDTPEEDQFTRIKNAKKERVEKNQKRQRRNQEESSTMAAAGIASFAPRTTPEGRTTLKKQLDKALKTTKVSTASMGRFDAALKRPEGDVKLKLGKRRGAGLEDSMLKGDLKGERARMLELANKVASGDNGPIVNVAKAAREHIKSGKIKEIGKLKHVKARGKPSRGGKTGGDRGSDKSSRGGKTSRGGSSRGRGRGRGK